MHQEIRLHGHLNETIEFFATAAARDAYGSYFYETVGDRLRFFAPGSEFALDGQGVMHRGNGGAFCEYMFGVDQPLADLAKGDVCNRLVLYGGLYENGFNLRFSDLTGGRQSYERIFFEGNPICNYFFFLTGSVSGDLREQQEGILRLLGKTLKRSPAVGLNDDMQLADELFGLLGHKSSLYLFRLIHKKHRRYHDAFRILYHANKALSDEDFQGLQELADQLGVDRYQQERIRIDVMYKHPENRRVVDEYKHILIDCFRKGTINQLENARLTRLKTLSVRNKIPSALFYTLDKMLKHDNLLDVQEQDYILETREILEGIFFHERQIDSSIDRDDMIKLLHAKKCASENRDHTFEHILLNTGKACDEKIYNGADMALLDNFSYILTYFDRYDTTQAEVSQLAFMENVAISEKMIRSLLGNRKAFDELQRGLFDGLFFTGVLENKYLGRYGRKKILALRQGLVEIEEGRLTVHTLVSRLEAIDAEDRLYGVLRDHVKERIRNFYSRYNTRSEQQALQAEVAEELCAKGLLEGPLPGALFRDVVVNIKKEAIYIHSLLPQIIADQDIALREDFLENSGLDRFYVEELEREYFELNNLDLEGLYQIRQGLSA